MTKYTIKKNEEKQIVIEKPGKYAVELIGKGARAEILGAIIAKGSERLVIEVITLHKARGTEANTFLRAVVKDKARVEIKGLIKIEKGAQKTKSFLKEDVLLISDKASAEAIPDLEIEADDIKASHAATVGKIDQGQVFYLMSRGLSRKIAEKIIVRGFLSAVRERIDID